MMDKMEIDAIIEVIRALIALIEIIDPNIENNEMVIKLNKGITLLQSIGL